MFPDCFTTPQDGERQAVEDTHNVNDGAVVGPKGEAVRP